MSARYFFHATDDGRNSYGPVPIETLRRWLAEGRLRDDSKLKTEGGEAFLTVKEVLDQPLPPPLPETETLRETDAPPLLRPAAEAFTAPPTAAQEAIPVSRLISNAVGRYGEALRKLWWVSILMQLPFVVLTLAVSGHIDNDNGSMPARYLGLAVLLVIAMMIFAEFGLGFMGLTLNPDSEGASLSIGARAAILLRRAKAILWTLFLRYLLVASLFVLFAFCTASAKALPPTPILRLPLYFFAALSALPALILLLRYLPSTLIVLFEGVKGLEALRRSGELVRFNQGTGLISPGDFRLFLMVLPAVAAQFFCAYFIPPLLAHFHLTGEASSLAETLLGLVSTAFTTPLYALLIVSFYLDALPRVPAGTGASKPSPK